MDEHAIRQLVRESLQRHLHASGDHRDGVAVPVEAPSAWKTHHSHVRFLTLAPGDGSCIVEPAVRCTHCGFCQSYGH